MVATIKEVQGAVKFLHRITCQADRPSPLKLTPNRPAMPFANRKKNITGSFQFSVFYFFNRLPGHVKFNDLGICKA